MPRFAHRFKLGETVVIVAAVENRHIPPDEFTIVRLLPESREMPQYQIKSKSNGQERVVREDQLRRKVV